MLEALGKLQALDAEERKALTDSKVIDGIVVESEDDSLPWEQLAIDSRGASGMA